MYVCNTHWGGSGIIAADAQTAAALHVPFHVGSSTITVLAHTKGESIGGGIHVFFVIVCIEKHGRTGHDGRLTHVRHTHCVRPQWTRVHTFLINPIIFA